MNLGIGPGAIVRLRKKHPCGGDTWQVVRLGADIGIKCLKCRHSVMLERSVFERRLREIVSPGDSPDNNPIV